MSNIDKPPVALVAADVPPRSVHSNYPEPYKSMMAGRVKRALGSRFGLTNFGVNLVRMVPGGTSALRHRHKTQDEFIYVLDGHPVLLTDDGETQLAPGMCAGFPAGGTAHCLVNRGATDVVWLEVGDRTPGDAVTYPDDDIEGVYNPDGSWRFQHKDGSKFD